MIIIYGASLSPFVRKTLVFAAEKGIEVENVVTGPGSPPNPDFLACSPFRKIPAMKDGDFQVCDSTAIVTYLDAIKPEPELIPTDPKLRARTIWFEEFADTILMPVGGRIFFNRVVSPLFLGKPGDIAVADKAEHEELPELYDWIESQIPDSGYLVDDRFTLADIAVASPFATLARLERGPDPARWPRLAAFLKSIHDRPTFAPLMAAEKAFLDAVLARRAQPA